jgi:hypothetical protein
MVNFYHIVDSRSQRSSRRCRGRYGVRASELGGVDVNLILVLITKVLLKFPHGRDLSPHPGMGGYFYLTD